MTALVLVLLFLGTPASSARAAPAMTTVDSSRQETDPSTSDDCGLQRATRLNDRGRHELKLPPLAASAAGLAQMDVIRTFFPADATLTLPATVRRALLQIYLM